MRLLIFRRFAVIALVVLSLFTTISHLIQDFLVMDLTLHADNPYSNWDEMMQNVKKKLPMKSGFVGYFADWDIPDANYSPTDQRAEYFLTQYGLAPLIVERHPNEWIIGNFSNSEFELWLGERIGNYEIEYLGFNIYLIHDLD